MDAGIGGKYTFSDGTPSHICIRFIFIANINASAYIFPVMISVYQSIFVEIFLGGAGIFVHFGEGAFWPFKVIQGR